ncbi:cation:proton antiporter domain-containing protein [Coleofasciculus sp. E2-BRE-01]|uniref:cation:proton antiporter domain-containing protein n=1 Tax=Coleofasciculus sp. E2-BRE-01 TaxID=3069524 RepID=UPI003301BB79
MNESITFLQTGLPEGPIVAFTILLLVSLTIPPLFERLGLPGLVGLLLAGVILGSNGLQLLDADSETMKLLSDIGKIYLMFVAGLEIDLVQFRKKKHRSLVFGLMTFIVPLVASMMIGRFFGFGWNTSLLMGSLFASHTLLGYPIVQRLGLVEKEPVIVTIGATIFTDISALLVLAICVSINAGDFSVYSLLQQLVSLVIYTAIVLFGFDWIGKEHFRRTGDDEGNQFLFVLLAVFLASVGAEIIQVDQIVGAFMAGLAVNDVVGNSPVKEKVEFVGSVLFIPFFFVDMGLLLDIPVFIESLTTSFWLTLAIVVGLLGSKFLAAAITKVLYRYSFNEMMVMWSLSIPQVAATLAAALVGLQVGLITDTVFNSVIVLMLITSILGPLLTGKFAPKLPLPKASPKISQSKLWWENHRFERLEEQEPAPFRIVVPVSKSQTKGYLIEMAALIARHQSGQIIPLSISPAHTYMDEPQMQVNLRHSRRLLNKALTVSSEFEADAKPLLRIENDIASGIVHTAREQDASLIVMSWRKNTGLRARLFGTIINRVFWASHCPVAVMRLLDEPVNLRKILVPAKNFSPQTIRTVRFAQLLADTHQGEVKLLHVCPAKTAPSDIAAIEDEYINMLNVTGGHVKSEVQVIKVDDVALAILKVAKLADMVILRSLRRRTIAGLGVSDITTQLIKELSCSLVLFGEPY